METLTLNPISIPPIIPSHLLSSATTIPQLKQIHARILRSGLDLTPSLLSRLLSLPLNPAAAPSLDYALSVLLRTPHPPSRLRCRAFRLLGPRRAIAAYARLRQDGVDFDRFDFPPLLRAAARAGEGEGGEAVVRETHGFVLKTGFVADPFVLTALVRGYAARGCVSDARAVFDRMPERDVVAWGVMLDGWCQSGCYSDALQLFEEMKSSDVAPDQVILATVLSACGRTGNLSSGKAIHSYILESGIAMDAHLQSSLINMYSNCGSMDIARKLFDEIPVKDLVASTAMVFGYAKIGEIETARAIFDEMPEKDLVCWSAMISGYSESDKPGEALKLFNEMQASGVRPDKITMLSVISACAHLGAIDQAKWIHVFIDKNMFHDVLMVRNALIDMYSKCGNLASAWRVFEGTPQKNVITWTSMITGLAMHGDGTSALALFERMKAEGVEPNGVTLVGLLYACSHTGLVAEGRQVFESMVHEYKVEPKLEHYGCMVDLLCRAKLLREAFELIESMPFHPNVIIWGSLLGGCRVHMDVELGEIAAKRILELDPDHDGAYVLLSNIYAKANKWDEVGRVRRLMKSRGVSKEKGCSWIEINGNVHEFLMGDESHPKSKEIYGKLEEIIQELVLVGYSPDTGSVLVDLEEEEKKEAVLLHSEKLALSFGLINSTRGSCIRIAKNLRVCEDCHSFMEFVSKVFDIEIVLRDRTRFHHYKNGVCSCKGFW
ncbi:pentatricopeptide repeat-containing protein At4g14820 [Dioscorea cayenensis subsp. rotundata]|uniref:Pentatricopeptide repeat-containing protein At4g14820 n=1 Tax=Dioscorea cayennensis subsp. rotundata TaxID=55577 RepID=A0AB40AH99_DIOCR|nr:pentatricopeptide repeat-containing protein At4g14820 [Dioscorea cayenensis subsp. rotundata]